MLVPKHLIAYVLSIILALTSRVVTALGSHEVLLFVNIGIEGFEGVTRVLFEFHLKKLILLSEHIFDRVNVGVAASEDISCFCSRQILEKLSVLVEK